MLNLKLTVNKSVFQSPRGTGNQALWNDLFSNRHVMNEPIDYKPENLVKRTRINYYYIKKKKIT